MDTKSQYLHIRLPRVLLDQARAVAEAEGMTLSELMRYLLRKHVQEFK